MNLLPRHSLFDIDSLLDHLWVPQRWREDEEGDTPFVPKIDVKERKSSYEIAAELPGIEKKDVKVTLDDGVLSIEAESNQEDKEEKDGKVIRQERRYGKFIRRFDLGRDVQESDIKAEFKNGGLKLDVPRIKEPEQQSKIISIR